jgi:hypothetical protein
VEIWLTRLGMVLCGLLIATTVVLVGVRVVAGPRTVNHVSHPCPAPKQSTTCVQDHFTGNLVGRPWMIVLGTLSLCAGAVGLSLREHDKVLTAG